MLFLNLVVGVFFIAFGVVEVASVPPPDRTWHDFIDLGIGLAALALYHFALVRYLSKKADK